jgi:dihydropteroate synthase
VVLDPGIGFGKTVEQNFSLLSGQVDLQRLGLPVLAGWSRKSSLGAVTGRAVDARVFASVAAATLALQHGARVLRVHDVAPAKDAVAVYQACAVNAGHYANDNANNDK